MVRIYDNRRFFDIKRVDFGLKYTRMRMSARLCTDPLDSAH